MGCPPPGQGAPCGRARFFRSQAAAPRLDPAFGQLLLDLARAGDSGRSVALAFPGAHPVSLFWP
jgi:hypothetical protein